MILAISHPDDVHAVRVLECLRQHGEAALLLDISELPQKATVTIQYSGGGLRGLEYCTGGAAYDLGTVRSIWWRRPQAPVVTDVTDADVYAFTMNEWQEALNGLWQLIGGSWMNPPARDEVAGRKMHQLRVAADTGMRIPRTLITSDARAAKEFVEKVGLGRTIFKTFSCTHAVWRETRMMGKEELEKIGSVRLAPVIFQEYVEAAADLRITIVGERIFAAEIDSNNTDYPVDFRMSLGQADVAPVELPNAIADRLLAFMKKLSLVYGAVDMRRTKDGDYVFLEVNTAGEFLFIEELTGQPITQAVADWLARPAAALL